MSWKLREDDGSQKLLEDDGRSRKALPHLQILPMASQKMSVAPAIAEKADFWKPRWNLEANWRPKAIYILLQHYYDALRVGSFPIDKSIMEMNDMTRKELKILFREYPDVVSLPELCTMMGGIGDGTARKLLRSGQIKSLMIRSTYYIPKKYVIDYLLSDHYKMYQQELKHGIAVSEGRSVKEDTK